MPQVLPEQTETHDSSQPAAAPATGAPTLIHRLLPTPRDLLLSGVTR
jgi:hypothetical protein